MLAPILTCINCFMCNPGNRNIYFWLFFLFFCCCCCFVICSFADNTESICRNRVAGGDALVLACSTVECECPNQPYPCPEDSVLVQDRVNDCCVTYRCVCPNISCPLFMECGQGVQPVPKYRGNQFPDRCCPEYEYIGECI